MLLLFICKQLVNKLPDHLFGWSIQHREHIHDQSVNIPVLEEVLQCLADGVSLLNGQQMLQLLPKSATLNPDAGRQNLRHPLKGAEHRRAGSFCGNATSRKVLLCKDKCRWTILHYQCGHGTTSLQHGHYLFMGGGPHVQSIEKQDAVSWF